MLQSYSGAGPGNGVNKLARNKVAGLLIGVEHHHDGPFRQPRLPMRAQRHHLVIGQRRIQNQKIDVAIAYMTDGCRGIITDHDREILIVALMLCGHLSGQRGGVRIRVQAQTGRCQRQLVNCLTKSKKGHTVACANLDHICRPAGFQKPEQIWHMQHRVRQSQMARLPEHGAAGERDIQILIDLGG